MFVPAPSASRQDLTGVFNPSFSALTFDIQEKKKKVVFVSSN